VVIPQKNDKVLDSSNQESRATEQSGRSELRAVTSPRIKHVRKIQTRGMKRNKRFVFQHIHHA
ncbi:unnamed protein product, partial [Heterosigma akashiwo]